MCLFLLGQFPGWKCGSLGVSTSVPLDLCHSLSLRATLHPLSHLHPEGPNFLHFCCQTLLLTYIFISTGQDVVTPPVGSPNNGNPTDCQIFTLTPPPATGRPTVTRAQLNPRVPLWTWTYFLQRPGFYLRLPNRPFRLPNYNYGFQLNRFYLPRGRLITGRYLGGGRFQGGSSSEESVEKWEAQTHRSKRIDTSKKDDETGSLSSLKSPHEKTKNPQCHWLDFFFLCQQWRDWITHFVYKIW